MTVLYSLSSSGRGPPQFTDSQLALALYGQIVNIDIAPMIRVYSPAGSCLHHTSKNLTP